MTVDEFIEKWEHCPGSERANYAVFLTELSRILEVETPGPHPDYQIDAPVTGGAAGGGTGFIDLYKRGCFILEAKQSKICELPSLPGMEESPDGQGQKYDELMCRAFRQARRYAQSLPEPPWPPFIIILDVGRAFEIYFDYGGNGRDYRFFPDRFSYRIPMAALRDEAVRNRLRTIWTNPKSLDPALITAEVTRDIAKRLGSVSAWLEETQRLKTGTSAADWERSAELEETSLFLMRILFCMFAEDAELLSDDPKERPFKDFLRKSLDDDGTFRRGLSDLWQKMGQANLDDRWTFAFEHPVKYFNGSLFADTKVYELARAERGELIAAAEYEWKNVEPAIFGTLLEQALTANQRTQLGAHYTPRPYVERIVEATITDVLRTEWEGIEAGLEGLEGKERLKQLRAFHDRLGNVVVLDPACGTGNFLYVSMEALLGIEAKVLQAIEDSGGTAKSRVGPGQLHGLEKNPRAAKIAELVLWIGWLRWRLRNGAGVIEEPVLEQKANINFGRPGGYDAVLAQDNTGQPILDDPHQPEWPEADFIVGNPPFIGKGSMMRTALGDDYCEALWKANPLVAKSADFVMQWWARAADTLISDDSRLVRFGLVTTNSITQTFNRRVIEEHLAGGHLSLLMAIPDHPWTKAGPDAAAVRIAMSVAERGERVGRLIKIVTESGTDTDYPILEEDRREGRINSDFTIGADVTSARPLRANEGLSCNGMMLAGQGFKISAADAEKLLIDDGEDARKIIRPYIGGGELVQNPKHSFVIDLFDYSEAEARKAFPACYSHLLRTVKPERDLNRRPALKNRWWIFAEPRRTFRPALEGLAHYIATTETTKHRIFQFVPTSVVPDHMIIAIGSEDPFHIGVLSSQIHLQWTYANCGLLGVAKFAQGHRYTKSQCFDPFPFPDANEAQRDSIAKLAKELDTTRKEVLAQTHNLTMTELYNLLEALRSGAAMSNAEQHRATIARAEIVNRIHEQLDQAVADAYSWGKEWKAGALGPSEIVARLVALNRERAAEEANGTIRWLRSAYQKARQTEKRNKPVFDN